MNPLEKKLVLDLAKKLVLEQLATSQFLKGGELLVDYLEAEASQRNITEGELRTALADLVAEGAITFDDDEVGGRRYWLLKRAPAQPTPANDDEPFDVEPEPWERRDALFMLIGRLSDEEVDELRFIVEQKIKQREEARTRASRRGGTF